MKYTKAKIIKKNTTIITRIAEIPIFVIIVEKNLRNTTTETMAVTMAIATTAEARIT